MLFLIKLIYWPLVVFCFYLFITKDERAYKERIATEKYDEKMRIRGRHLLQKAGYYEKT